MITFFKQLLGHGQLSTKRFIAIIGTLCICGYTFVSDDAVPITTIVMTAIGGNVVNNIYGQETKNTNQNKEIDTNDKTLND